MIPSLGQTQIPFERFIAGLLCQTESAVTKGFQRAKRVAANKQSSPQNKKERLEMLEQVKELFGLIKQKRNHCKD